MGAGKQRAGCKEVHVHSPDFPYLERSVISLSACGPLSRWGDIKICGTWTKSKEPAAAMFYQICQNGGLGLPLAEKLHRTERSRSPIASKPQISSAELRLALRKVLRRRGRCAAALGRPWLHCRTSAIISTRGNSYVGGPGAARTPQGRGERAATSRHIRALGVASPAKCAPCVVISVCASGAGAREGERPSHRIISSQPLHRVQSPCARAVLWERSAMGALCDGLDGGAARARRESIERPERYGLQMFIYYATNTVTLARCENAIDDCAGVFSVRCGRDLSGRVSMLVFVYKDQSSRSDLTGDQNVSARAGRARRRPLHLDAFRHYKNYTYIMAFSGRL
ncbi:hypothetical protein EVAR_67429_1 [Eumeta japonica]|uniref:Uncharacterized protein n=1 Tax=Eumeta variegata TaxID=151549 RepID=A0A4C1SEX4_EUMVA|nr:hypothetical protein EVAR_67429_1 [Eumeta japonica]